MKEKEIRKLTWKYFWEAKINELGLLSLIVLILIGLVFVFYGIGIVVDKLGLCNELINGNCIIFVDFFLVGLMFSFALAMVSGFIYLIISVNWKNAKKKAEVEIKNTHTNVRRLKKK